MSFNYPYLPPNFCPDCGRAIPQGTSCPCYAGSLAMLPPIAPSCDTTAGSLPCKSPPTRTHKGFVMQFRKKPVVIDAVQINTHAEARKTAGICTGGPDCKSRGAPDDAWPHVHSLEGDHTWTPGDWLITGVKGERYFCKPDIFAATYEHAIPSDPATPATPDAVRMLTPDEWRILLNVFHEEGLIPFSDKLQRKFCEVNAGKTIPASPEGTKP